jgi:uncharacterized protein (DUF736 family)
MGRSGRGSAAPRSPARNSDPSTFFPCADAHSSRGKKVAGPPSSAALWPQAVRCDRLRSLIAIEAAIDAARATDWTHIMATIGTFTKSGDDGFIGSVKTLALNVEAKIVPTEKDNDKAPDFRIFAGTTKLGAAWKKTSNAGREYLSVKLDDPSFPAPIYAPLVTVEGSEDFALIWSRRTPD